MTREKVVQLVRAGEPVAWLTDRGAIVTCQTGGVDLIPLASRLYFKHRNDQRSFVDGVAGLSCVCSATDGDDRLDQLMSDTLWSDLPEPPRDQHVEQLVDELMAFHGLKTPMEKQMLREMVTESLSREVRLSIGTKL